MKDVAERIKLMREQRGMTQQDLAEAMGLKSRSSISKIEKDTYTIGLEMIKRIARALNCDPDYLAFGNEEDKKEEINRLFDRLDESQQNDLLGYIRSLLEGEQGQS